MEDCSFLLFYVVLNMFLCCLLLQTLASACGKFAPFEIKEHMSLAPLTRVQCEDAVLEELDHYLSQPDSTLNGLKDWTKHKPRRSGPTRPHRINSVR